MYCIHCGAKLMEGAKFCQSCGKPVYYVPNADHLKPDQTPAEPEKSSSNRVEREFDPQKGGVGPGAGQDVSASQKGRPVGVKGWLLFFVLLLVVVRPIFGGALAFGSFLNTSEYFEHLPSLAQAALIDLVATIVIILYGMHAGILLWNVKPEAVASAKKYLVAVLVYNYVTIPLFFVLVDVPEQATEDVLGSMFGGAFWGTVWFLVWYFYLIKSERVKNTFCLDSESEVQDDLVAGGSEVSGVGRVGAESAPSGLNRNEKQTISEPAGWGSLEHFLTFLESEPERDRACAYIRSLLSSGYDRADLEDAIVSNVLSGQKYFYKALVWDCE